MILGSILNGLPISGRVLVVEDLPDALSAVMTGLSRRGYSVRGMFGVRAIEDGVAVGPGPDGEVSVDLREVEIAFLDHYFLSDTFNGTSLTAALTHFAHLRIVGMSSEASANARMVAHGAFAGYLKRRVLAELRT